MATASEDRTVKLWSRDGRLVQTLAGQEIPLKSLTFSPDGKTIASSSSSGKIILWNFALNSDLDELLIQGCQWIRDYLRTNRSVKATNAYRTPDGRALCDEIQEN
jgi:WD40 repeat protein